MIPDNICLEEVMRRTEMNEIKDCAIVGNALYDLHITPSFKLQKTNNPTNKEIRLALDIIRQMHPKWTVAD